MLIYMNGFKPDQLAMNKKPQIKPKVNPHETLETYSEARLTEIFKPEFFELRNVRHRDKGVDMTIEIKDEREEYSGFEFIVQLKATQKPNRSGKHTRTIKTINIEYLLSRRDASMYILYIKDTDSYYFEWTDDFVRFLIEKAPDKPWEKQPSHVLHFKKALDENAVKEIYHKILREGEEYRRRKDRELQGLSPLVDLVHGSNESASIHDHQHANVLELLQYLFDTFAGLTIIPIHIVVRLPPFALGKSSNTYYSGTDFTLYTDNPKLFDFFNNLYTKNNTIHVKGKASEAKSMKGWKKRIENALAFCEHNNIHHIGLISDQDRRICVHKLFLSKRCDCVSVVAIIGWISAGQFSV